MKTYSEAFDLATRLPHWVHWLLCVAVSILTSLLENPHIMSGFGWGFLVFIFAVVGLIFSVISRLLMLVIPWFYASIARQLPTSWLIAA
jgi:hypothetical protein